MNKKKKSGIRFVVCLENKEYAVSLEKYKIYRVLSDPEAEKKGDLRIIDESGTDYIYPKAWFVKIDVPETVESSLIKTA